MLQIDLELSADQLRSKLERLFELSAAKIRAVEQAWDPASGPPVVTVEGSYRPREWTDWTRGWDHVPEARKVPCGESSMWGDFHAREFALMLLREVRQEPDLNFFTV